MNPFRLMVYAIATLLIIWVFFTFIAPLFISYEEPVDILLSDLDIAETMEGRGKTTEILYKPNVFAAQLFDTGNRSVAFECTSPVHCCNIGESGEDCKYNIQWDERRAIVKQELLLKTTVRCSYAYMLYSCKIYIGEEPAQVAITETDLKEKVDLDAEKPVLKLRVENKGDAPIFYGTITGILVERYLENNRWEKRQIGDSLFTKEFGEVSPHTGFSQEIEIEVPGAGFYEIEVRAWGDNAGFDTNSLSLEAVGGSSCRAVSCNGLEKEFGECKTRCFCEECMLSSDCEKRVRMSLALGQLQVGGSTASIDFDEASIRTLGSNIAEVLLPDRYC